MAEPEEGAEKSAVETLDTETDGDVVGEITTTTDEEAQALPQELVDGALEITPNDTAVDTDVLSTPKDTANEDQDSLIGALDTLLQQSEAVDAEVKVDLKSAERRRSSAAAGRKSLSGVALSEGGARSKNSVVSDLILEADDLELIPSSSEARGAPGLLNAVVITNVNEGIGYALTKCILEDAKYRPRKLFMAYKDFKEENAAYVKELEACYPGVVRMLLMNTSQDVEIERAVTEVGDTLGVRAGLTLLVNNCGRVEDCSDSDALWDATSRKLNTHMQRAVTDTVMVTQNFLRLLEKSAEYRVTYEVGVSRAMVVNVCHQLGEEVGESALIFHSYHYRVARDAIRSLTSLMADELASKKILVVAMLPGWANPMKHDVDMHLENDVEDEEMSAKLMWQTLCSLTAQEAGFMLNYDGMVMPW